MAFELAQREALHLLQGIENGTLSATAAGLLIDDADPALVYLLLTWLRSYYAGDRPGADAVIARVVEITGGYNSVKAKMREGKADPVVAWFEEEYSYREFSATAFVELIVEKLEG